MKKILYLSVFALLSSCITEKNAEPGKPLTFVRYFNGGNNDVAQVAEETSDKGIIILGTIEIFDDATASISYKIKLIKTDEYGNLQWQKVYPDFGSTQSLRAHSVLQLTNGGFMIIGESVLSNGKTEMYILPLRADGTLDPATPPKTIDFSSLVSSTLSIQGQAIQINNNDNYLVLGAIQDETDNMLLAELDKSTLAVNWVKKYGAGASTLSNKIFLDASNNVFWSGTVTRNSSDVRLVKTAQNSLNTLFDLPIGTPNFQESGNDICRYGFGFAVVGTTDEEDVNQDILFKILAEDGSVLFSSPYGFGDADAGNSVCTARGGLIILGTSNAVDPLSGGRGEEDYFLIKVDAFGNEVWPAPRVFGSKNKDLGASVRQMSDGSLLVLGTTVFGGVKTIMLMKADSEGNIE
jgi:hypothetical protein